MRTVRAAGVAVMLAAAAAACHAHRTSAGDGVGSAVPVARGDSAAQGTVRVVGAEPAATVLLVSDSGSVALTGALAGELAAVDGARVEVRGRVGPAPLPLGQTRRAIAVAWYRILERVRP